MKPVYPPFNFIKAGGRMNKNDGYQLAVPVMASRAQLKGPLWYTSAMCLDISMFSVRLWYYHKWRFSIEDTTLFHNHYAELLTVLIWRKQVRIWRICSNSCWCVDVSIGQWCVRSLTIWKINTHDRLGKGIGKVSMLQKNRKSNFNINYLVQTWWISTDISSFANVLLTK